ncbi:hypothetical protein [Streptomyces sp. NPDC059991]|uniref:hypothetical protein n=1 Tax=unclassified Streptomyces TaxID=2593676 RepID=UPI0036A7FD2D
MSLFALIDAFASLAREVAPPARVAAARGLLALPGAEAALVYALDQPARRTTALQIARVHVADAPGASWHLTALQWMRVAGATWQESASFCADVAWSARQEGRRACPPGPAAFTAHAPDPITARTLRHLYLAGLRYEFRCADIQAVLPRESHALDPYTRALGVFAALGRSQSTGVTAMHRLLDHPAAAADPKVAHAVLHGLWLGERLPHQGELMLAVLRLEPFARREDPLALSREARAWRKVGDLDAALECVERAFGLLPPASLDLHADLVRERGLITIARDLQMPGPRQERGSSRHTPGSSKAASVVAGQDAGGRRRWALDLAPCSADFPG